MAERIAWCVHALREGDDAAKTAAAQGLSDRAALFENRLLIAEVGGIPPLVELLSAGSAEAKEHVARALGNLALHPANRILISAAGATAPLVELLGDWSAAGKCEAACALRSLACNDANKILIAEAGAIPPLVQLLHDGRVKSSAAWALHALVHNNDTNAVAIAVAFGLEAAVVQLARRGLVTFKWHALLSNASIPAKRKAALVVAVLLGGCVPDSARDRVPDVIKAAIGSYL